MERDAKKVCKILFESLIENASLDPLSFYISASAERSEVIPLSSSACESIDFQMERAFSFHFFSLGKSCVRVIRTKDVFGLSQPLAFVIVLRPAGTMGQCAQRLGPDSRRHISNIHLAAAPLTTHTHKSLRPTN